MAKHKMFFIRSQPGIDRSRYDWDFGLANFGYEQCDVLDPIALIASNDDGAVMEAAQRRHEWCLSPLSTEPEG